MKKLTLENIQERVKTLLNEDQYDPPLGKTRAEAGVEYPVATADGGQERKQTAYSKCSGGIRKTLEALQGQFGIKSHSASLENVGIENDYEQSMAAWEDFFGAVGVTRDRHMDEELRTNIVLGLLEEARALEELYRDTWRSIHAHGPKKGENKIADSKRKYGKMTDQPQSVYNTLEFWGPGQRGTTEWTKALHAKGVRIGGQCWTTQILLLAQNARQNYRAAKAAHNEMKTREKQARAEINQATRKELDQAKLDKAALQRAADERAAAEKAAAEKAAAERRLKAAAAAEKAKQDAAEKQKPDTGKKTWKGGKLPDKLWESNRGHDKKVVAKRIAAKVRGMHSGELTDDGLPGDWKPKLGRIVVVYPMTTDEVEETVRIIDTDAAADSKKSMAAQLRNKFGYKDGSAEYNYEIWFEDRMMGKKKMHRCGEMNESAIRGGEKARDFGVSVATATAAKLESNLANIIKAGWKYVPRRDSVVTVDKESVQNLVKATNVATGVVNALMEWADMFTHGGHKEAYDLCHPSTPDRTSRGNRAEILAMIKKNVGGEFLYSHMDKWRSDLESAALKLAGILYNSHVVLHDTFVQEARHGGQEMKYKWQLAREEEKEAAAAKKVEKPKKGWKGGKLPKELWEHSSIVDLREDEGESKTPKQVKRLYYRYIRRLWTDARSKKWNVNDINTKADIILSALVPGPKNPDLKILTDAEGSWVIAKIKARLQRVKAKALRGAERGWPAGYGRGSKRSSKKSAGLKYGDPGWQPDKRKSKKGDPQFEKFYADLEKAKLGGKLGKTKKDYYWLTRHRGAYKALLSWAKENNVTIGAQPKPVEKPPTRQKTMAMWLSCANATSNQFAMWQKNRVRHGFKPLKPGDCLERGLAVVRTGTYAGMTGEEMKMITTGRGPGLGGTSVGRDLELQRPAIDTATRERQVLEASEDAIRLFKMYDGHTDGSEEKAIEQIVRKHLASKTIGLLSNLYYRVHSEREKDSVMSLVRMLYHEGSGSGGADSLRKLAIEVEKALSRPTRGEEFRTP